MPTYHSEESLSPSSDELLSPSPDESEINVPSDASIETYKYVMRKKDAIHNRTLVQLANQGKELADARNATITPVIPIEGPKHRKRSKNVYLINPDQRLEVENCAKKFTYMNMFWLRPSDMESVFRLTINPNYNLKNRFLSLEEQHQGILAELHTEIPHKWHCEIKNKNFINQFLQQMSQQRSNASTHVRQSGPLILGCPNEVFNNDEHRGSTFKELIGYCVEDGVEGYDALAPILYKEDLEQTDSKWKIFRHPILLKTYSALVRGINSIKNLSDGQVTKQGSHTNLESKWGLRRITPGAIAMSAILARFTASGDHILQCQGSQTRINYQEDYEEYFEYLYQGLVEEAPSIVDIFKIWNEAFYPKYLSVSDNNFTHAVQRKRNNLRETLRAEMLETQQRRADPDHGTNDDQLSDTPNTQLEDEVTGLRMPLSPFTNASPFQTQTCSSSSLTDISNTTNSHHKDSRKHAKAAASSKRKGTGKKRKHVARVDSEDREEENTPPPAKQTRRSRRLH